MEVVERLIYLSTVYSNEGDIVLALKCLYAALKIIQPNEVEARIRLLIALLLQHKDNLAAYEHLQKAFRLAQKINNYQLQASILCSMGECMSNEMTQALCIESSKTLDEQYFIPLFVTIVKISMRLGKSWNYFHTFFLSIVKRSWIDASVLAEIKVIAFYVSLVFLEDCGFWFNECSYLSISSNDLKALYLYLSCYYYSTLCNFKESEKYLRELLPFKLDTICLSNDIYLFKGTFRYAVKTLYALHLSIDGKQPQPELLGTIDKIMPKFPKSYGQAVHMIKILLLYQSGEFEHCLREVNKCSPSSKLCDTVKKMLDFKELNESDFIHRGDLQVYQFLNHRNYESTNISYNQGLYEFITGCHQILDQSVPIHHVKTKLLTSLKYVNSVSHDSFLKASLMTILAKLYKDTDKELSEKMLQVAQTYSASCSNCILTQFNITLGKK